MQTDSNVPIKGEFVLQSGFQGGPEKKKKQACEHQWGTE